MGAFADFDAYNAALKTPNLFVPILKLNQTIIALRNRSKWLSSGYETGVAPTTAVACSRTTTGALPGLSDQSGTLYPIETLLYAGQTSANTGWGLLVDRLSHQGGLDGTVTTQQTTNLPTAALTRYTTGVGVMAALEVYTAVGTTATTATINYTNQAGTGSRTSQAIAFGGASDGVASVLLPVSLASGDTGVRSVQGVTLAASTLTAGSFGVTLFKPLLIIPMTYVQGPQPGRARSLVGGLSGMPAIEPTACLMLIVTTGSGGGGDAGYMGYMKLGMA